MTIFDAYSPHDTDESDDMSGKNAYQQQFQNAGQQGSFIYSYNSVGNNTWVFPALILSFVLLVATLRSETRYRMLLEQAARRDEGMRRLPVRRVNRKRNH